MVRPRVAQLFPMLHPSGEERLSRSFELVTVGSADPATIIDRAQGAVALIARSPAHVGADVFDALPDLAIVSATGSGADCVDVAAASARGIPVLHYPGVAPTPVSEYVIGAILVLRKRLLEADAALRGGVSWEPKQRFLGTQATGTTLGIIGFGNIGRDVARRARNGMNMHVVVHSPTTPPEVFGEFGVEPVGMAELLRRSDVVSLHVPLRDSTRGLIRADELALMKPNAILINTARGAVVDERALIAALRDGTIAGAALDVFDPEPPARDNPLFELPNTLVTPHIGGVTQEGLAALAQTIATELIKALRVERPAHLVAPEVWPPARLRSALAKNSYNDSLLSPEGGRPWPVQPSN